MNPEMIRNIRKAIEEYGSSNIEIVAYMHYNLPEFVFEDDELLNNLESKIATCYYIIERMEFIDFDSLVVAIGEMAINPNTNKLSEYFEDQWIGLGGGSWDWIYDNFEIDPY